MKSFITAIVLTLGLAASASAQSVLPGDKLGWDAPASNLAAAQAQTYMIQVDTAAPFAATGVTCTGTVSPFACVTAFPAATPGVNHEVKVAARATVTVDGKPTVLTSSYSTPLVFQLVVIPGTPVNVRRIPGVE